MSVYVDEIQACMRSKKWPYGFACHLVADSVEELHYFAGRMGLKPAWFQDQSSLPHYDLTKNMRLLAVKLGAIEIDRKSIGRNLAKFLKSTGQGVPDINH
ncbi:hypothetical protein ES703_120486 [subsurface metagenome]